MQIKDAASGIANYLARELEVDQKEKETIRFGMEVILGSIIKGIVILGLSLLLGITPYAVAVLITAIILRLVSGGVHCNTYARCLTFSILVTIFLGEVALLIGSFITKKQLLLVIFFSTLIGFYNIRKYAPVDNVFKPIKRKEKKEKLKRLSFIFVTIWAVGLMFITIQFGEKIWINSIILGSIGGFFVQIFSLSPIGHRFISNFDNLLSKISI